MICRYVACIIGYSCVFLLGFCKYLHGIWNGFGEGYANAQLSVFLHHQEAETGFVPSVQDFDKKLAEADAYLQILIDQLKVGITGAMLNQRHHLS